MTSDNAPRFAVLLSVLLLVVSLLGASTLHAQAGPRDAEPAAYRALLDQALSEYEAQHFAEARALFARAHALYPNARVLRGLGMVEFELRNYGASIAHLEAALASPVRPLTGALRERTEQLLARARGFVAHFALEVTPARARVMIDGMPLQPPAERVLVLEVGDHVLEVHAGGYLTERRTLRVAGGERESLRIALQAGDGERTSTRTPGSRAWSWVVIGVSGALTATGASLLVVGKQKESEVEQARRGVRWSELEDDYQRATRFNTAAFALGGVGLAGLASGLVWKLVSRAPAEAPPLQVSGVRGRILLTGRF